MGNRRITMALACILAAVTSGIAAEKAPAQLSQATAKRAEGQAAETKTAGKAVETKRRKASKEKGTKVSNAKRTKKSAGKSDAESTGKKSTKGRLPRSYGKLKLTEEQRAEVLAIQRDFDERIKKLLAEIEQLESHRDADFEKVLDKSQRDLLQELTLKVASTKTTKAKSKKSSQSK